MATTAVENIILWQHNLSYGRNLQYELAILFIAAKTNVGYSVVGEFVVQSETTEQVAEALSILLSWNPEWQPLFFMTDISEAEIGAISAVFPTCQSYTCVTSIEKSCGSDGLKSENMHGLSLENAEISSCATVPMPHLR